MSSDVFRSLPPVQDVFNHSTVSSLSTEHGRERVMQWIREALADARHLLSDASMSKQSMLPEDRAAWIERLAESVQRQAMAVDQQQLTRVINATGIVLHTGLGRAPLSAAARHALSELGGSCNVEVDLETCERRYRGHQLEAAFRTLTGCEDALIVNNNAAATLLTLQALASGREVIISRGQLIEIGGSFRLPDIFSLSGALLREVGTTNRTHLSDFERAVNANSAAVMEVHPSNYRIVGFSTAPSIEEVVPLARKHGLIAIDDIGSGALIDVTKIGLPAEPTFQQSISAGADIVLGSGDKLLGGPQCGIILGKREFVERLRRHPLARAVRVGKLTLAALQATLDSYLQGTAIRDLPMLAMLAIKSPELQLRAERLLAEIGEVTGLDVSISTDVSAVGGGSLPAVELPTIVLRLQHDNVSAAELSRRLRIGTIRVFGRIQHDAVLLDLRSVLPDDDSRLALAVRCLAAI